MRKAICTYNAIESEHVSSEGYAEEPGIIPERRCHDEIVIFGYEEYRGEIYQVDSEMEVGADSVFSSIWSTNDGILNLETFTQNSLEGLMQ